MKSLVVIVAVTLIGYLNSKAQDVQVRLDDALASYRSDDLENARFSLQEALNEINKAVGMEILKIFPEEMDGMEKVETADDVTGMNVGFAALFVHRTYRDENREASIDLISDSPMLAGVNAILAMPGFMTSDSDQKRIKVDGYKALLTKDEAEDGSVSWDLQVPLQNSLLTFECNGTDDENKVIAMAGSIPVRQIAEISE